VEINGNKGEEKYFGLELQKCMDLRSNRQLECFLDFVNTRPERELKTHSAR
jgi:hypothetical protein